MRYYKKKKKNEILHNAVRRKLRSFRMFAHRVQINVRGFINDGLIDFKTFSEQFGIYK